MPVRVLVTEGTAADCSQAVELIEGIDAESLLADKAYDTTAILSYCEEHEVIPVVPPKRNREHPIEPRREFRRLFCVNHAASAVCSVWR